MLDYQTDRKSFFVKKGFYAEGYKKSQTPDYQTDSQAF
jgi:hypothetical protein